MARRNTLRKLLPLTLYHVYNREINGAAMFLDAEDRAFFRGLLARYLSTEVMLDARGRPYRKLRSKVRVAAFAICRTHFHLIVFQIEAGGMEALMRSVNNSYVAYFKAKYGREVAMFNGEYRAVALTSKRQKLNTIAYVNENHGGDCHCEFCSHRDYLSDGVGAPEWLSVRSGLECFGGVAVYREWVHLRRRMREICGEA